MSCHHNPLFATGTQVVSMPSGEEKICGHGAGGSGGSGIAQSLWTKCNWTIVLCISGLYAL